MYKIIIDSRNDLAPIWAKPFLEAMLTKTFYFCRSLIIKGLNYECRPNGNAVFGRLCHAPLCWSNRCPKKAPY